LTDKITQCGVVWLPHRCNHWRGTSATSVLVVAIEDCMCTTELGFTDDARRVYLW